MSVHSGPRARRLLMAAVLGATASIGIGAGESRVVVNVGSLDVRQTRLTGAPTVAVVRKGAALEVLGREGKFLKVRTPGGQEGFVFEGSVADASAAGATGLNNAASALLGGPEASAASGAEAAKGLGPYATQYARGKGLHTADADKLLAQSRQDVSGPWAKFTKEGKVGPDKPQ